MFKLSRLALAPRVFTARVAHTLHTMAHTKLASWLAQSGRLVNKISPRAFQPCASGALARLQYIYVFLIPFYIHAGRSEREHCGAVSGVRAAPLNAYIYAIA